MVNSSARTNAELLLLLDEIQQGRSDAVEHLNAVVYGDLREIVREPLSFESSNTWIYGNSVLEGLLTRFCEPDVLEAAEKKKALTFATIQALKRILFETATSREPTGSGSLHQPNRFDALLKQLRDAWGLRAEPFERALTELEQDRPALYPIVMCRFFGGLTISLTAIMLDREESVVSADWKLARALLRKRLGESTGSGYPTLAVDQLFYRLVTLPEGERDEALENIGWGNLIRFAELHSLYKAHQECEEIQFLEPTLISPIYALWSGDPVIASTTDEPLNDSTTMRGKRNGKSDPIRKPSDYLDRYRLLECVGKGGFAQVWRGYDPLLQRVVAVKIPRPDRLAGVNASEAFLSEARKLAGMKIPGVVQVYDTGCADGCVYVVSEFMEGGTLAQLMSRVRLPVESGVGLLFQVAKALHSAHKKGLIHRDIKPGNILIDAAGQPFLADFGLAVTELEQLEESGAVVGTPAYMPPEQARGDSHWATPYSDIYSLGVVLYELLTGRLPFVAKSLEKHRGQVINRPPRPLRTIDDSIPKDLEAICLKCLEKTPEKRYTSAADLAGDLEAWLGRRKERWKTNSIVGAFAAAALLVGAVFAYSHWNGKAPLGGNQDPGVSSPSAEPPPEQVAPVGPDNAGNAKARLPTLFPEIAWPGYVPGEAGSWSIDANHPRKPLIVTSFPPRLIQTGTLGPEGLSISLDLHKLSWEGYSGVFWGYEERIDAGQPTAYFHLIRVVSIQVNTGGVRKHYVQRTWGRILPSTGMFHAVDNISAPVDIEGNEARLEIRFENNRLARVAWDGEELGEFTTPEANERFQEYKHQGPWGVLNAQGTAWFMNLPAPEAVR